VDFTRIGDFTWRVSDCEELVGVPHRRWWSRSASIPFEKLLKGICLDNETVWRDFNECNASFESLACWGHHHMGLPWER